MTDTDPVQRTSDMIDAYCAAHPAPEWRFTMPTDLPFLPRTEPLEVSYLTQASVDEWYDALTDQQRQAIDTGAAMLAEETGVGVEWARDAFIRHLAMNGSADG